MYLILNQNNLIADITPQARYVKSQSNGVTIGCGESDAEAVYSANTDTFYPLKTVLFVSESYTLHEVGAVPDNVTAGYYFYRNGEYYPADESQIPPSRQLEMAIQILTGVKDDELNW